MAADKIATIARECFPDIVSVSVSLPDSDPDYPSLFTTVRLHDQTAGDLQFAYPPCLDLPSINRFADRMGIKAPGTLLLISSENDGHDLVFRW